VKHRPTSGALAALVALVAIGGCGAQPESDQASLPTLSADTTELPIAPAPSTTTPIPVDPYNCDDTTTTIAESILIERRQGRPISNCSANPDPWLSGLGDFVDFELDSPNDAADTVRFSALYRTSESTSAPQAESLRFELDPDTRQWLLVEHSIIDLTRERSEAEDTMSTFFVALETADYSTAADLLTSAGRFDRPDLERLVDEGLLDSVDSGDVAEALAAWCQSGAECRTPDEVRYDITAQHTFRAVGGYDSGPTRFDVAYEVEAGSVRGLPPLL